MFPRRMDTPHIPEGAFFLSILQEASATTLPSTFKPESLSSNIHGAKERSDQRGIPSASLGEEIKSIARQKRIGETDR